MNLYRCCAPMLVFCAIALSPSAIRADVVGFSYSWSVAAGDLGAGGVGPITLSQIAAADGSSVTINYGGGTATLAVAPSGSASTTPGGTDFASATPAIIPVGTLMTFASTGPVGSFWFSAGNQFTLHLTDTASGQSGDMTLFGSVNGTVAPTGSNLVASVFGNSFQTLQLGTHTYSVDTLADLPGSDPGSLFTQVFIDRPDPSLLTPEGGVDFGSNVPAPEPSSLLLAGTALSFLGGLSLRKRRNRAR